MAIAGTSGPRPVDLPEHDSEKDDGQAYKVYARVIREGPPPKKYSMLPINRGSGRWWDILPEERRKCDVEDVAFMADLEADAIVLEAMHRPRRHQEVQGWTRAGTKLQRYECFMYCNCASFLLRIDHKTIYL
jgi:hypothetical protein